MLSKHVITNGLRPNGNRRAAVRLAGAVAILAGLSVASPRCLLAMDEVRIAFIEADDGLTRESIPVLNRPDARKAAAAKAQPAPAPTPAPATASAASDDATPAPRHHHHRHHHTTRRSLYVFHHRHHRWHHHRAIARKSEPPSAPAQPPRRRNWVERFVVWWNGFADRRLNGVGHVPLHDA